MTIIKGILPVYKESGSTSFRLVSHLRKLTRVQKIGHAGTLDPFATGVMVMLIGSEYTKKSNQFLESEKQYSATIHLGITTDTYDIDGTVTDRSNVIPSLSQVEDTLSSFQGTIQQVPPMFSAKKIRGKKLYELARQGIIIERQPVPVHVKITLIHYAYPKIDVLIDCSKGTYIRSLAFDIGQALHTGAHLSQLTRTKSGTFTLEECISESAIQDSKCNLIPYLRQL